MRRAAEADDAESAKDATSEEGRRPQAAGVERWAGAALEKLDPQQKFTQPPPRYNEASLVKMLEEKGIGRPSTYASIINTIQDRDYVKKIQAKFVPTEIGTVVTGLLVKNFPYIFDTAYTATLERRAGCGGRWRGAVDRSAEWLLRPLREGADGRGQEHGRHQADGAADEGDLRQVRRVR